MNCVTFNRVFLSLACIKDSNQIIFNAGDIFNACLKFWTADEFKSMVFNDIYNHGDDPNFPLELHKSKVMLYLSSECCSQYLPADFTDVLFEMIFLWTNKDPDVPMIRDFAFNRAVIDFKRHNPKAWCFVPEESFDDEYSTFFINKTIHLSNNGKKIFVNFVDVFNAFGILPEDFDSVKKNYLLWLDSSNTDSKNFKIFDYLWLNRGDFLLLLRFFSDSMNKSMLAKQIFNSVNVYAVNLYKNQHQNLIW